MLVSFCFLDAKKYIFWRFFDCVKVFFSRFDDEIQNEAETILLYTSILYVSATVSPLKRKTKNFFYTPKNILAHLTIVRSRYID